MNSIDTNTLLAICTCAIGLTQFFLWRYIARNKSYESEKGKNLATKEDIEEITKKIELVKNEIGFEKQRENEYLKERKETFLNFLNEISIFSIHKNRLEIYLYNYGVTNDILRFQEEFIKDFKELCQTYTLLQVYFTDKDSTDEISNIYYTSMDYINKLYSMLFHLTSLSLRSSYNTKHPNKENFQKIEEGIEALHRKFKSDELKKLEDKYNDKCIKCCVLISIFFKLNFHQKINFLKREAD